MKNRLLIIIDCIDVKYIFSKPKACGHYMCVVSLLVPQQRVPQQLTKRDYYLHILIKQMLGKNLSY